MLQLRKTIFSLRIKLLKTDKSFLDSPVQLAPREYGTRDRQEMQKKRWCYLRHKGTYIYQTQSESKYYERIN